VASEPGPPCAPPGETRWRTWLSKYRTFLVAGLLAVFFLQVVLSMQRMSVTVDEFAHLPSGYAYWDTGDFAMYRRNPPLIKMWAALPLFRSSLDKSFTGYRNLWSAGYAFMFDNEAMYHTLYVRCRVMIALLGVGLGYLVFRWSRELFGVAGGLLSLAVYAFSPNVIGHAGVVTTDLGAAAMYTLACYTLYKLDEKWSAGRLAFAGIVFGLAMITKFSCLALVPLAPVLLVLGVLSKRRDPDRPTGTWRRELGRGAITLGVLAVSCLIFINAGYGFSGSFKTWASFEHEAEPLRSLASSCLGQLPAPFPEHFLGGLAEQREASVMPAFQYLFGEVSQTGWWYYYLGAFLLKVPLPVFALLLLAAYAGITRCDRRAAIFVVVPAVYFFIVFSLGTRVNVGLRYMLPVFPLLFVAFGAIVRDTPRTALNRPVVRGLVGTLVVWLAIESAVAFPHYIAYFNEFAGGHGERYLVDSNCDWSQDHITLRRFMQRNGIERVHLATFGRVDAKVYDVRYETLRPEEPVTGDVVISVSLLAGHPYWTPDNGRTAIKVPADGYAWLRAYTPVRRIGGSLYYFRIEPESDEAPTDQQDEAR